MNAARHLAQFNVARIRFPLEDPRMAGFVEGLEPLNRLADEAPGFVWRLHDDSGNATSIRPYPDPRVLVTLSVWRDRAALEAFVYSGTHGRAFARRHEWFEAPDVPANVLWWIEASHVPSVAEAVARLEELRRDGPGREVFALRPPPGPSSTQP